MANHASHGDLPYPVRGARYTVLVPYLDADGDPTAPTTPDTEISKDAGAAADCAEEVSAISGMDGMGMLTLSGAEMDAGLIALNAKVASGPKATLLTIQPRRLPVLATGTAQAGAGGSITLASGASALDGYYVGCLVKTTGGTGGGGTGGANNQARLITGYTGSSKVATVAPDWETNPSSDTTYEVLWTEMALAVKAELTDVTSVLAGVETDVDDILTAMGNLGVVFAGIANLVIASGTIGDTGNDTTHLHLPSLTQGDDEIKGLVLVITDVSETEKYAVVVNGWVASTKLSSLAEALPFTPEDDTDTWALLALKVNVAAINGTQIIGDGQLGTEFGVA